MKNACYDVPDERDYKHSDVCWTEYNLPKKAIIDDIEDYQNQWAEEVTHYACAFFSTVHWVNILNDIEWVWEWNVSWKDISIIAIDKWLLKQNFWAAIQSWPKLLKTLKHIKGWDLCENIEDVKHSITIWRPVIIWSNLLDFNKTIIEAKPSYWHAILVIWYDDDKQQLIIKESYWKTSYDKWLQYLPYNLFDKLFLSKYSLIDRENSILTYKKQIMNNIDLEWAKILFDKWIWNWLNPKDNMSRQEVMQVLYRVIEKLEKWEKIL